MAARSCTTRKETWFTRPLPPTNISFYSSNIHASDRACCVCVLVSSIYDLRNSSTQTQLASSTDGRPKSCGISDWQPIDSGNVSSKHHEHDVLQTQSIEYQAQQMVDNRLLPRSPVFGSDVHAVPGCQPTRGADRLASCSPTI